MINWFAPAAPLPRSGQRFPPLAVAALGGLAVLTLPAKETTPVLGPPPPDKCRYTLLHPGPAKYRPDLTPDRPDKTESRCTLDAGHLQMELDFANFTYDRTDGATTRAWNIVPVNFKISLLNSTELQFIFDCYPHVRTEEQTRKMAQSGVGDFARRLKVNLRGDDGGQTASALLPFVKFPTPAEYLGNQAVEGGMIFPFAVKLPADFDMGLEAAASFFRNDNDSGYHAEFINSVTFGHALVGKLDGYVEFFSSLSTERHAGWVGTVDVGLEYAMTKNVQLDCGCSLGVTRAADDVNSFAGITVRF
jgi:Putative MetA-pathway of phenol degradation